MDEQLSQWETRVSAIETNHLALQKDVAAIARNQAAHEQALEGIETALKTVVANQTAILTPKWGVMATMFGAVMLVAGLVLFDPLNQLREHHRVHIIDGHPQSVLDKIHADERKLEERLDRKQFQLLGMESRLDDLAEGQARLGEKFFSLEREVYNHDLFERQRPTRP